MPGAPLTYSYAPIERGLAHVTPSRSVESVDASSVPAATTGEAKSAMWKLPVRTSANRGSPLWLCVPAVRSPIWDTKFE